MEPLALPSDSLVYLDASGLIYSVERVEPYRTLLEPMWQYRDLFGANAVSPVQTSH